MTFEQITDEALNLDIEARAELAHRLLVSLDEPSESEVEKLWLEEIRRRVQDYRDAKVETIPADEVFRRLFEEIA
ncbi:MAG: addiction module protein [Thermodesulfobacteriota bacterium]